MRILPSRLSADTPEHPPIDFDQMERDMRQAEQIENSLRKAVPLAIQQQNAPKPHTSLQIIAQSIVALTWAEAEAMGADIKNKMSEGKEPNDITRAIQAWAAGWEGWETL